MLDNFQVNENSLNLNFRYFVKLEFQTGLTLLKNKFELII